MRLSGAIPEVMPGEFFNANPFSPQKSRELLRELEKLPPARAEHILQVIRDLGEKR